MKTLLPELSTQTGNSVAQEQVDKKHKEYHLIGKQRKVAGHILFEFNRKTKEIRPADISRTVIVNIGELKRIMGFGSEYTLIGTQAEQKKYIGNAVEVNMSRALCVALYSELNQLTKH